MAYTRIDGELADFDRDHPWKKEYVSHMEDGIDDCESQCAELKGSLTELESSAAKCYVFEDSYFATPLEAVQTIWESLPTGFMFARLRIGTRFIAILQKYNASNGCAICFGYGAGINPPHLIRLSSDTWYDYTFDTTAQ